MTAERMELALALSRGQSVGRRICIEELPQDAHRGSALYRLLRLLIGGSKDHAFLDRPCIGWLLACTPARWRTPLALRLLSFSPHYWIYQFTGVYPRDCPWSEVLRLECQRNVVSRRQMCDTLLRRYLRPDMIALDFGCGPGFMARAASAHVQRIIATDVSRGVIACARQLNAAPNITYVANRRADLSILGDASIDLVYSFAVLQHLLPEQVRAFLGEFARVLKPGGLGVCHILLRERPEQAKDNSAAHSWMYRRVTLRTLHYTADEAVAMLREAGFRQIEIVPVASLANVADDIRDEHLLVFRR
jgi:ubiquinone/menaquinone biosynthesis C-methylase UbiE